MSWHDLIMYTGLLALAGLLVLLTKYKPSLLSTNSILHKRREEALIELATVYNNGNILNTKRLHKAIETVLARTLGNDSE